MRRYESWLSTSATAWRVVHGMIEGDLELARQLCTRAGMIMEDAAAEAVRPPIARDELPFVIIGLQEQITVCSQLLDAAGAVLGRLPDRQA